MRVFSLIFSPLVSLKYYIKYSLLFRFDRERISDMTPWIVDRFQRCRRICHLGFHVARSFFNPFGPHFLDTLAFELWYLMTHEQEASSRLESAAAASRRTVNTFSFADDMMLYESPGVDEELEACLLAAEDNRKRSNDGSTDADRSQPKVSILIILMSTFNRFYPEKWIGESLN